MANKILTGTGKALRGTEIISAVDYHLEIYETFIQNITHEGSSKTPGMVRIEGTVRDGSLPIGEKLTLVTREGYALDFFLVNKYGTISVSGPLLNERGEPVIF